MRIGHSHIVYTNGYDIKIYNLLKNSLIYSLKERHLFTILVEPLYLIIFYKNLTIKQIDIGINITISTSKLNSSS